jgi:hypothetical protein
MPVAFFSAAQSIQTSTVETVATITITTNSVLVVGFFCKKVNGSVSAVALNGTALTQLGRIEAGAAGITTHIYGLTAPAAGIMSLSAKFVGTASIWGMHAVTYTGAKASNCFGTVNAGTAVATNVNLSISSTTNDRVVGFFCADTDLSATNGTTRLSAAPSIGTFTVDIAGVSSTTLSATVIGAIACAFAGLSVIFSVTSSTTPFGLALMGCGS